MPSAQPTQAAITGTEKEPRTTPPGALAEFHRAFKARDLDFMEQNWDSSAGSGDGQSAGWGAGVNSYQWRQNEPIRYR